MLDERCNIAPGAVFCLEGAIIFVDHEFHYVLKEAIEPGDVRVGVERRRDQEVKVTSGSMAEHAARVAVPDQKLLYVDSAVGQSLMGVTISFGPITSPKGPEPRNWIWSS